MALVGGLEAPPDRVMGHAGAWAAPGEPDAKLKYKALEEAGAVLVSHPEKFGNGMKTLLGSKGRPTTSNVRFVACLQRNKILTKIIRLSVTRNEGFIR